MASIQTQFYKFHNTIKVDFDDNQPLRDKRDLIIKNLQDGLKKLIPTNTPTFNPFNQGSYDLATGVLPIGKDDYDIDVGIVFNFNKDAFKPVQVKEWILKALASPAREVEIMRPCVRVQYYKEKQKNFHVDLAVYALDKNIFGNEIYHIAKGFIGSSEDKKIWERSEPFKLKELLKSKINDNLDREQFRRVIRYLKRWKDYNFSSEGTERPTGIAITACCYNKFSVVKEYNYITKVYEYNDLKALVNSVTGIINTFDWNNRIIVNLPVSPNNNLFEKMSEKQMLNFKNKLIEFKNTLVTVSNEPIVTRASMRLRSVFGDFPIS